MNEIDTTPHRRYQHFTTRLKHPRIVHSVRGFLGENKPMEYELLKQEIVALDDLRIALSHVQRFPEIYNDDRFDVILEDIQRAAKRIHDLVNPNEGGMLVSEMVETPQYGDVCLFWDNNGHLHGRVGKFKTIADGEFLDEMGRYWINCKVIKKGEGNV